MPLLVISFLLSTGCGILHPPHKDAQGFYTAHYNSCGPVAVKQALDRYFTVNNIIRPAYVITPKEISQHIQRDAPPFPFDKRQLIIIFHREGAEITWPFEVKAAFQRYGIKLTKVPTNQLYLRNNPKAVYIVLVHKKWTLNTYHWYAYPGRTDPHAWGNDTVFDVVYLLEPIKKRAK